MKIYISKGKKTFCIRFPLGMLRLIPAGLINHVVSRNHHVESTVGEINFAQLKKAVHLLKEYRGMNIIEVVNSKGEEVVVRI